MQRALGIDMTTPRSKSQQQIHSPSHQAKPIAQAQPLQPAAQSKAPAQSQPPHQPPATHPYGQAQPYSQAQPQTQPYAPSPRSEELRILSVHGKGEGPLALDGHDALFTASKPETLSSLSTEHSVVKSLERGREDLTAQQTPDTILTKEEEEIGGGMPAVASSHLPSRTIIYFIYFI
ncbi:unnamed protein product [Arctogadus glacialis]